MIRRWPFRIRIFLGVFVLTMIMLVGMAAYDVWHQNRYKTLLQTLPLPAEKVQIVLLTDISGFGDRAWYVYQMPIGARLTNEMLTGHDEHNVLFWNYSEAGDHYDNPKIEMLKDRYLLFSRGGLYHSLYDLRIQKLLVNDESPWNSFQGSDQFRKYGENAPSGSAGTAMDVWVRNNLHKRIESIVNGAL